MLKRLAALSSLLLAFAACGDDKNPNSPDANPDDIDADPGAPDAEPPMTTHSATISVLDVRVNTAVSAVGAALGSGSQVVASMTLAAGDVPGVVDAPGQIYDDRNATGIGCAAFVWDLAAVPPEIPPASEGHGTVTVTGSTATIPTCSFVGDSYVCLAGMGMGGATSALSADIDPDGPGPAGVNANLAAITVPGATWSASDVGRYVKISGAAAYRNNGAFPIVAFSSVPAPTLIYVNPPASAQADLSAVAYLTIAGAGPSPSGTEFLADDDMVTVALDAPASDPFEDFTTSPAVAVGDNFSLTPASTTLIHAIPVDGSSFMLGCDAAVFSQTGGTGGFNDESPGADQVTVTATGIGAPNTRVGAEVTIAGATTATHNGTFTITAVGADSITYTNAAATLDENFAGGTTITINDCGAASVTALNVDFSNAQLKKVISAETGTDNSISDSGATDCILTNAGNFQVGMDGAFVTISGATNAANNGTFPLLVNGTASAANSITYTNAACVAEIGTATTAYELYDDIAGVTTAFLMPDPATAHATKIGHIQCAALASQTATVPAGASAAIMMVDPNRIRTTFVRSGLAQGANADGTNPINVLPGHAVVGFTTVP